MATRASASPRSSTRASRRSSSAPACGSPTALAGEPAVAALEAGVHVLVEKPMAVTLADAEAIGAAASAAGRTAAVAYGWNYSRLSIWAKEMLEAGRIGRVTSVTAYKASS